ncbi:MAG: hypothetical protein FD161_2935 [Limisphaerales bacterium]|nr:MAG: hypothetical protein FD161_2935 [Limisphaerales bacterium]TXT48833.1 MAG: hypothetical protein FD140_3412 [Limisphaerales bacterium]
MHPETEDKLAVALHLELRKLPPCPAPAELVPNVLAALARGAQVSNLRVSSALADAGWTPALRRAWWERSWFEWPRAIRRLAGAATGVMLATLVGVGLLLLNLDLLLGLAGSASEAWGVVGALGNALSLLGRAIPTPALLAVGALLAASYLCAIALGTVFYRCACQRRATA